MVCFKEFLAELKPLFYLSAHLFYNFSFVLSSLSLIRSFLSLLVLFFRKTLFSSSPHFVNFSFHKDSFFRTNRIPLLPIRMSLLKFITLLSQDSLKAIENKTYSKQRKNLWIHCSVLSVISNDVAIGIYWTKFPW